jgi:hypothetical protein
MLVCLARSSRCDSLLAKIPIDADLTSYDSQLTEFRQLIHAAVTAPQVLAAVATKVLHRKRRNLILMLDSVLTNCTRLAANAVVCPAARVWPGNHETRPTRKALALIGGERA